MQPFAHKTFIGDFFDVLHAEGYPRKVEGSSFPLGDTRRHEASISLLSGNLGLASLPELVTALDNLLITLVRLIVLDLSRVTELSPNAAGILVNYQAAVQGSGKRLVLFRPAPAVLDVLGERGLLHLFEIQQTEDELLLALPD